MNRVAVSAGSAWVRVAVDDPRPRLLAELPVAEGDASGVLAAGLTALLDRPAEELIVVHGDGPPPAVPPAAAAAVRVVPAAVAALGCHLADTADATAVPADVVVVDAGRSATDVVRVSGGRVVTACRVPVGGTVLDDVTAELLGVGGTVDPARARAVREELSLLPLVRGGEHPADPGADAVRCALAPPLAAVVAAVRTVVDGAGPGRSPPVLLIGGVARTPLLAELLDAAGMPDVRVAERPDAAAVVGALRLPAQLLGSPLALSPTARSVTGSHRGARSTAPAAYWLPPVAPARHRPLRALANGAAAAVALAGLYVMDTALPAAGPVPLTAAGDLVQYGYGVADSGGVGTHGRIAGAPAQPPDTRRCARRQRPDLRRAHAARVRRRRPSRNAPAPSCGRSSTARWPGAHRWPDSTSDARFAGRPVVTYRETVRGTDRAEVDWYVVLDGEAQLSVGCRHTAAGTTRVAAACATVVDSLHRTT